MLKELQFINDSSRVGITCRSAGSVLLGTEAIARINPLSVSQLRRDRDGCVVTDKRAVVQVGSRSWYDLLAQSFLAPGIELDVVNTAKEIIKGNRLNYKTSTYPSVVLEQGVNPILVVATPSSNPIWDESNSEQELSRIALRRLVSKEAGFELQHMLTMVLHSLLTGEEKALSLQDSAHDTHHSQSNAKSAISRNFLKGSSKLGLLTLGKNANSNQWIVLQHNGDELVSTNVSAKLTAEEEVKILSNGIAVAVHKIIQSGITQDNPNIKPRDIGSTLVDTALDLSNNYQKSAGNVSAKLAKNLRSTRST